MISKSISPKKPQLDSAATGGITFLLFKGIIYISPGVFLGPYSHQSTGINHFVHQKGFIQYPSQGSTCFREEICNGVIARIAVFFHFPRGSCVSVGTANYPKFEWIYSKGMFMFQSFFQGPPNVVIFLRRRVGIILITGKFVIFPKGCMDFRTPFGLMNFDQRFKILTQLGIFCCHGIPITIPVGKGTPVRQVCIMGDGHGGGALIGNMLKPRPQCFFMFQFERT